MSTKPFDKGYYWVHELDDPEEVTIAQYGEDAYYGRPGWYIVGWDAPYHSSSWVIIAEIPQPEER